MGPIKPTRGIRQGDPISPYLFILCAQGLTALNRKYEMEKWLHGVKISRRAPVISHMLFADDSYIYYRANMEEAGRMMEMLEVYEKATGQKVNMKKSSVFFSANIKVHDRANICEFLGMVEANENRKYLGLPSILGRKNSALLGYLKDKVLSKVQKWDGRWVSKGEKKFLSKMLHRQSIVLQ
ncbi:hypothetical protein AgCh_031813 [Apium graveolens]